MYRHFFKRLLDIVLSLLGIVVFAVPMLIIAVIIKIDSPGPVLFKQKRIGIHKSTFTILKFRSMPVSVPHDMPTHQFTQESSLSRWQHLERKLSIDELPQLYNIFVGQMSIVGPRPALWNQYNLIAERDKYGANDIKPGLTGWAQVNGRDALEIEEKARYDGEYVQKLKKHGLRMDWICCWMTVGNVLRQRGVIEGGTGVMAKQIKKCADESPVSDVRETEAAKR